MIINCKPIREKKLDALTNYVATNNLQNITCTIVQVGSVSASDVYVNSKINTCCSVGIKSKLIKYKEDVTEQELLNKIYELNKGDSPYLVQLPLPAHISEEKVIEAINPHLDIDGFTKAIKGDLFNGTSKILPCTVQAILDVISYELDGNMSLLKGINVVIAGRSNIVGKPLALELINRGATVTVCNSKTDERIMANLIADAELFISAINQSDYFNSDFFKRNKISLNSLNETLAIDVGIEKILGKLHGNIGKELVPYWLQTSCGTVDGEKISGVGALTTCCVVENTIKLYETYFKTS